MFARMYDDLHELARRHATTGFYLVVLFGAAWGGSQAADGSWLPLFLVVAVVASAALVQEPMLAFAAVFVAMVFGGATTLRLPGIKLNSAKLATAACFGAWAVRSIMDRRPFLEVMPATATYVVVGSWMLVVSAASLYPDLASTKISTLVLLGAMCHLIYTAVDMRTLAKLMDVIAAASILALALGAWIGAGVLERSSGVARSPNEWAFMTMLIGYATLGWLVGWKHRFRTAVLLLVVSLIPLNLAQAASRAGALAFLVTLPGGLYLLRRDRGVLLGGVLVGAALLAIGAETDLLQDRMEALQHVDRKDASINMRMDMFTHGVKLLWQHPLFGTGLGTVPLYNSQLFPLDDTHPFHNSYLTIVVEQGVPGMVLHVALIATWGGLLARAIRNGRSERLRALALGLSTGLAAFAVMMTSGDYLMSWPLAHFLLGLGLALERMTRSTQPIPEALQD
jgi:hypothetical protein